MRMIRLSLLLVIPAVVCLAAGRGHAQTPNSVSVADAGAAEGTALRFPVTLASPATGRVTVTFRVEPGTASAADFTAPSNQTVVFGQGEQAKEIEVPTVSDAQPETHETLSVRLMSAVADETDEDEEGDSPQIAIDRGLATGTIRNDDFQLNVADSSVTELNGQYVPIVVQRFTATLDGASAQPVSFRVRTSPGTAFPFDICGRPADFASLDQVISIDAHATLQASMPIGVTVVQDRVPELDETYEVSLSEVSVPLVAGSDLRATGTIVNDDAPPALHVRDARVTETDSESKVRVRVDSVPRAEYRLGFSWRTFPGNTSTSAIAGEDYTQVLGGSAQISSCFDHTILDVPILADRTQEKTEYFQVGIGSLSPAGVVLGDGPAWVDVLDDDTPTVFIEGDQTVVEGPNPEVAFRLSKRVDHEVRVPWRTVNDDARSFTPFKDYEMTSGLVVFPAGTTNTRVTRTIEVYNDDVIERTERFWVEAAGAATGGSVSGSAEIKIQDDEGGDYEVSVVPWTNWFDRNANWYDIERRNQQIARTGEGDSGTHAVSVSFSLWNVPGSVEVTFDKTLELYLDTDNGTATVGDGDYSKRTASAFFLPGEGTITVNFWVNGDTKDEPNEHFSFDHLAGYTKDGTGAGRITHIDSARIWIDNDD